MRSRYAILAIADHLDHAVMFGFPLVKQERNPHNYFKDHQAERVGLEHTQTFCEWLREVKQALARVAALPYQLR